jgi:hypothetical protein
VLKDSQQVAFAVFEPGPAILADLGDARRLVEAGKSYDRSASLAVGEVGLEEFQGVGHVGPAEADADVVWLVVDRAREEQYADLGEPRTVSGEVTDARNAGESDGASRGAYPLEGFGVPLEEAIEEGQVMPHDREVAVEKDVAVPESERGQELTRRARADGRVVLQRADGLPQGGIAGGDPADP